MRKIISLFNCITLFANSLIFAGFIGPRFCQLLTSPLIQIFGVTMHRLEHESAKL